MSIAAQRLPRRGAKSCIKPEQRFLLDGVSWENYESILKGLGERRIRATYDRGRLELMMPGHEHERIRFVWSRLVSELAEEFNHDFVGAGSATHKRRDVERGLEADDCFYIRSWPRIRGKRVLDLSVDPPPDLALEVDVTSSCIERLPIYAALRVPEVWRFDGETIHVLLLNATGEYEESDHSLTFPDIPVAGLAPFLLMWEGNGVMTIVRAFHTWLRQQRARSKKKGTRPRRRRGS